MTHPPQFNEPVEAPRRILQLLTEMGSIELWASRAGYRLQTDDQTPMLEDEPGITRESGWLDWDGVWAAIERYKWTSFRIRQVDATVADEVQARAQARLAREPERMRAYLTERWNDGWLDMLERG